MIIYSLALLAGIGSLQFFSQLPEYYFLYGLLLLPLCLVRTSTRWLAWMIFGFYWAWFNAAQVLDKRLPKELEGKDLLVQGYVASIPDHSARRQSFLFDVKQRLEDSNGQDFPIRIKMSWYYSQASLEPGQFWQFRVRLKRPHGMLNPGGFDYEQWMFRAGIQASGYVRKDAMNRLLREDRWAYPLTYWRYHLAMRLNKLLSDDASAAFIPALTIGQRRGITTHQWDVLRITGTGHLMAISGLHIGLISGFVYLLTRLLMRGLIIGRLLQRPWSVNTISSLAAMIVALIYAALAGFSVPTQRALIMVLMFFSATLLKRHINPFHILSSALIIVLLIDPAVVLSAGFWLSFLALYSIFYLLLSDSGDGGKWLKYGRLQLMLSTALVPASLLFFQQASWLSPLTNLLAIPWMTLLVVPLSLIGTALLLLDETLAGFILQLAVQTMDWIWVFLEYCAQIPLSQWFSPAPLLGLLPLVVAGLLLLLSPRTVPLHLLGLFILLPLLLMDQPRPSVGAVWLTLLDVGQGTSLVVRTKTHTLVFDAGARYSDSYDMGRSVVAPFLTAKGIDTIDYLVISHGDNDHMGGARSLYQLLDINKVYSSVNKGLEWIKYTHCRKGDGWQWDGVSFLFLYPSDEGGLSGNNASCVLRVEASNGDVMLLTGDIEKEAEEILLATNKALLQARVLVVPHHGSKTSSGIQFIAAVNAEYALISSGYRNRFRLPAEEVVKRYQEHGVTVMNSAREGAITFYLNESGQALRIERYRDVAQRYWH